MKLRAALFDLDGTLLDTLEDIGRCANDTLRERGFPTHPVGDYRRFVGEGVAALFQHALPAEAGKDRDVVAGCAATFGRIYDAGWDVASKPYPGVLEMLDALRARKIPMGVLSNKPHDFALKCVGKFFPGRSFDVVFGMRDGVPRKPDPAGAVEAASRMGVAAAETLYLGDTSVDMRTATAAGMFAVGAAWGFRSVEELEAHGAKAIVQRPSEILAMVGGGA